MFILKKNNNNSAANAIQCLIHRPTNNPSGELN